MQISHGLALIKLIWKNYLGNKSKLRVSYLIKTDLCMIIHYLKTLNALNVYQINLLQVLLFMHKIKTNSSPRIFLHQFQTTNHKYATRYSRNNFKEPKKETNYAKYCIHAPGPVVWNSFLNETEKTYYRSISLNVKSKKRYLNLKKNWASFKHRERNNT